MIEIKFPANRPDIASAIGLALCMLDPTETAKMLNRTDDLDFSKISLAIIDTDDIPEDDKTDEHPDVTQFTKDPNLAPLPVGKQDEKNVVFNTQYCADSANPFYKTGPMAGQWKRKRGTNEADYTEWYTAQLELIQAHVNAMATDAKAGEPAKIDTADAFSKQEEPVEEQATIPQDLGSYMVWVSAKQAGGLLTQVDITDAFTRCGFQLEELFDQTLNASVVAERVTRLYNCLLPKAGA